MNDPSEWTNTLSKATWTLLFAALGVFVCWQLLRQVVPMLLVVGMLLVVYRLMFVGRRRGGW